MDVFQKTLSYISLSSEFILLIILLYRKLQKLYIIYFNSFYLLLFNIISLVFLNLILMSLIPNIHYNKYYLMIISLVFLFSYISRIKRIIDCISLSQILKSSKIKNKSKLLYEKSYYAYETFYFICFIILSISTSLLFYFLQQDIITKYTLLILSIVIFIFFCFKILKSDMKKKYKKNYIIEIILSSLLFSNLIYLEINFNNNPNNGYQYIILFIIEILFVICIYINCNARQEISEDKLLISKKIKSDFNLFFNNELCFYAFNSYLNKNESDSNFYMKLYIDINKYKMKICLNENSDYIKNIIDFYDNNEQYIKNSKIKEKLKNIIESGRKIIDDNKNENNIIDDLFVIIHNLLNTKFESFKKSREYKKIFFLLDLLYFLDEIIFVKSFYFDYIDNEELQLSEQ